MPALTVENTIAPEVVPVLEPDIMSNLPPVVPPAVATVFPDIKLTVVTGCVPIGVFNASIDCALLTMIDPPFPAVAAPVSSVIFPLTPLLVVPVWN